MEKEKGNVFCHRCHKTFRNKANLNKHSKFNRCLFLKPKAKCLICCKVYSSEACFNKHMTHGCRETSCFQCHYCKALFSLKSNLIRHITQNTCQGKSSREGNCIIENCDVYLRKKTHLVNHLLEAHGDEPTYENSPVKFKNCKVYNFRCNSLDDFKEWLNDECRKTSSCFSSGGWHTKGNTNYVTYHCHLDQEVRSFAPKSNKTFTYKTPNVSCPARINVRYDGRYVTAKYFQIHNHALLSKDEKSFIQKSLLNNVSKFKVLKQLKTGVYVKRYGEKILLRNKFITMQQIKRVNEQCVIRRMKEFETWRDLDIENEINAKEAFEEHSTNKDESKDVDQLSAKDAAASLETIKDSIATETFEEYYTSKDESKDVDPLSAKDAAASLETIKDSIATETFEEYYTGKDESIDANPLSVKDAAASLETIKDSILKKADTLFRRLEQERDESFLTQMELQFEIWLQQCSSQTHALE